VGRKTDRVVTKHLPIKDKEPPPASQAIVSVQALVERSLQITTKHGRYGTSLFKDCYSLGQFLRAVPAAEQCRVSRKGTSFKQAAEEAEDVKLAAAVSKLLILCQHGVDASKLTVSTFFAPAMAMTMIDQRTSHRGIQIDGRTYRSCTICVGTVPIK
jgi:hypothetical protein